jgi:hypothetical protein
MDIEVTEMARHITPRKYSRTLIRIWWEPPNRRGVQHGTAVAVAGRNYPRGGYVKIGSAETWLIEPTGSEKGDWSWKSYYGWVVYGIWNPVSKDAGRSGTRASAKRAAEAAARKKLLR